MYESKKRQVEGVTIPKIQKKVVRKYVDSRIDAVA
jgi:hypothetical protein